MPTGPCKLSTWSELSLMGCLLIPTSQHCRVRAEAGVMVVGVEAVVVIQGGNVARLVAVLAVELVAGSYFTKGCWQGAEVRT